MNQLSNFKTAIIFSALPCLSVSLLFNEKWVLGFLLVFLSLALLTKHPSSKLKFSPMLRWCIFILIGVLLAFIAVKFPSVENTLIFSVISFGFIILWPIAKEMDVNKTSAPDEQIKR